MRRAHLGLTGDEAGRKTVRGSGLAAYHGSAFCRSLLTRPPSQERSFPSSHEIALRAHQGRRGGLGLSDQAIDRVAGHLEGREANCFTSNSIAHAI
jgi:hypothetical protein